MPVSQLITEYAGPSAPGLQTEDLAYSQGYGEDFVQQSPGVWADSQAVPEVPAWLALILGFLGLSIVPRWLRRGAGTATC